MHLSCCTANDNENTISTQLSIYMFKKQKDNQQSIGRQAEMYLTLLMWSDQLNKFLPFKAKQMPPKRNV